jgi:predicted metallopeptidase
MKRVTLLATVGLLLVTAARSDIPLAEPVSMPDCQALGKIEPLGVPSCDPLLTYLYAPQFQAMTAAPHKASVVFLPPVYAAMGKAPRIVATLPVYVAMGASVLAQSVAPEYASVSAGIKHVADAAVYASVSTGSKAVADAPVYGAANTGSKAVADAPVYASASVGSKAVADAPVYASASTGSKAVADAPVYGAANAGIRTIADAPVYARAKAVSAYQFGQTYAAIGSSSWGVNSTQLHPLMSADGVDYINDVVKPTGLAKEFYRNAKRAKAAGDTAGVLRWTSLYMREMDSQAVRNTMRRE